MNLKKTFLIASLGLVASLQAQEVSTPEAVQTTSNAEQAIEPGTPAATEAAATAETVASPSTESTAVQSAETVSAAPDAQQGQPSDVQGANTETIEAQNATVQVADSLTTTSEPDTQAAAPAEETVPAQETAPVAASDSAAAQPEAVQPIAADSANVPTEPVQIAEVPATNNVTKSPLDVLHSNTYNTIGNEAAGATIGGNIAAPRKMHGIKGLYVEPINERAAISFGNNTTYFVALDNSQDLGVLTAGMAFNKFGFSVDGSFGKQWVDVEQADDTELNASSTVGGSSVGATASLLAGSFDFVLSGHYTTPETQVYSKAPGNELEQKVWDATGKLTVSYSGSKIFWTVGSDFLRHDSKVSAKTISEEIINGEKAKKTAKMTISDTSSRIEATPIFNIGAAVLEAEDAKIYIGANTRFPFAVYDEIDEIVDSHTRFSAYITPNVFGEVAMSKYFMLFGGANLDWNVFSIEKRELNGTTETTRSTASNITTVNLGSRFEYGRVAAELAFTKQFLQNPFGSFSTTDEIAVDLGVFINF